MIIYYILYYKYNHTQCEREGSLGNNISSIHNNVPSSNTELFTYGRFFIAGPHLTLPNLS